MSPYSSTYPEGYRELTAKEFQTKVLGILERRFGRDQFRPGDDAFAIGHEQMQIGLQNLYAIYHRDELSDSKLEELVVHHIELLRADEGQGKNLANLGWEKARPRLRVQIVPTPVVNQAPSPLVVFPLLPEVSIGVVMDLEDRYAYVRREDLLRWEVSEAELRDCAMENLRQASSGIEMHGSVEDEKFLATQVNDSYDAARILLPGMRRIVAETLGEPFFVGIPNRDFLFCWAESCSAQFQEVVRAKIRNDFQHQPYPLTPTILVATREALRSEEIGH